ncbi:MAG: glycosyltransferase [Chloroflexota bacterium]
MSDLAAQPALVNRVEVSRHLPELSFCDPQSPRVYARAISLVTLHGQPLGIIELHQSGGTFSPEEYAQAIMAQLAPALSEHLLADGLPPQVLGPEGLSFSCATGCQAAREQLLSQAPLVTIVVSTRDHPQGLASTLSSLCALDYPAYEVVVVDNAPTTDATAEVSRSYSEAANVRYIREDRPGLSHARNRGVAAANGDIIAFTDDDAMPDSQWLTGLVQGFAAGKNVGCVTGLVVPRRLDTPAQLCWEQFAQFGKGFSRRLFDPEVYSASRQAYLFSIGSIGIGANFAMKTSTLRQVGPFDPSLGAGTFARAADDMDMFMRTLDHGFQISYEPRAIVDHVHEPAYAQMKRKAFSYGVGLGAFMTKACIKPPCHMGEVLWRVPAFITQRAFINNHNAADGPPRPRYPRDLKWRERMGILYGPFAYMWSHLSQARSR